MIGIREEPGPAGTEGANPRIRIPQANLSGKRTLTSNSSGKSKDTDGANSEQSERISQVHSTERAHCKRTLLFCRLTTFQEDIQ
jgi:hypothetical protein